MTRFSLAILLSWCAIGFCTATPVVAQGLLGTPHFDTEFVYFRPDDSEINRFDSFINGVQSNLNIPLMGDPSSTLGLDAYGRFRGLWIEGNDGGFSLDGDIYQYSVGTNLFFQGWGGVRPWLGTGYQHSDAYLKLDGLGNRFSDHERGNGFQLTVGVEADVFPMLAVRHSFEFNTEKFKSEDFQNPDYLAEFIISPPMNHWYLRLGAFIDFDGNGGALAGTGVRF
ncbi:MAG: hypothetical protein NT013_06900 [Planctomycetia bacterium]|nr:hypothetical protein [Planctomycetia bacterium]